MKTLRVSNGDIVIPRATGIPSEVEGYEKSSQDVAEAILSVYEPRFDTGNELLAAALSGTPLGLSDALVQQFLYAAVSRLVSVTRNANHDTRIIRVNQIKTRIVGLSNVVFLVDVLYSNGETGQVVNFINIKPTELNQLINFNSVITT